jgi:hypothetical protein
MHTEKCLDQRNEQGRYEAVTVIVKNPRASSALSKRRSLFSLGAATTSGASAAPSTLQLPSTVQAVMNWSARATDASPSHRTRLGVRCVVARGNGGDCV